MRLAYFGRGALGCVAAIIRKEDDMSELVTKYYVSNKYGVSVYKMRMK